MPNTMRGRWFVMAVVAALGCTPSADQLKKAMEANPEILFSTIEKNPQKFMEVVQKAAREAEKSAQENAMRDEQAQMDEEFKNPKKPEIADDRAFLGEKSAAVTIVTYSDFQCPYCQRGYQTMDEVMKAYKGKVRLVFKHLPLDFHPMAMPAAKRFEAIALQSTEKAFKFHDEIFKAQSKLNQDGEKFLDSLVKKVGANLEQVKKDMESEKVQARIAADIAEAQKFGISGTPGFVVGGITVRGAYPLQTFKQIIDRHLKGGTGS